MFVRTVRSVGYTILRIQEESARMRCDGSLGIIQRTDASPYISRAAQLPRRSREIVLSARNRCWSRVEKSSETFVMDVVNVSWKERPVPTDPSIVRGR